MYVCTMYLDSQDERMQVSYNLSEFVLLSVIWNKTPQQKQTGSGIDKPLNLVAVCTPWSMKTDAKYKRITNVNVLEHLLFITIV